MVDTAHMTQPIGCTLEHFIKHNRDCFSYPNEELLQLFYDIVLASKGINQEINKAGLRDILGPSGHQNTTGDAQQKLDVLAHNRFVHTLSEGGEVCALASEESDSYESLNKEGNYVVAIDPLDGSSNIDVNAPIGSIFSLYRRKSPAGSTVQKEDVLQKGSEQIVAGYVLYGPSAILVYTSGHGVNGFTYEPSLGDFLLSYPNIKAPEKGTIYSINEGQANAHQEPLKNYLKYCKDHSYTARYIGSLVADFHRNLLKGGIYIYPSTEANPKGKLRLLYECNPLAWIAEQAGGKASDGKKRILDIQPDHLHQRTSFYIGSQSMVEKAESF